MIFKNSEKGVSLIITFFILTIVLAVVLGISIVLYREIKIIRNIGNSVVAFYLADSGIEKTLYYDRKNKPVGVTSGVCAMCDAFNPTCPSALTEKILNCDCAILAGADCDPLSCTSCDVSFNTDIGGNKNYNVAASVSAEDGISDLRISSTGDFWNTKRAIKVSSKKEEEFGAPRWLDGWTRRKKIVIQNDYIDYDLIDFPLYVKIADDADMSSAMAGGNDIRFTLYDGTTLLKYEKERWQGGAGSAATADFWVRAPILTSAVPTSIYIYYGNPGASDGQDINNTWDNNFVIVAHLPNGAILSGVDSTFNGNNGAIIGAAATTGVIDGASDFNGGDGVSFGSAANPANSFTYSGWFKTSANHEIDDEDNSSIYGVSGQKYMFHPNHGGDTEAGAGLSVGKNGVSVYEHGSYYMPATAVYAAPLGGNWNYVSIVYNNKQPTIYLNGLAVHTGLISARDTVYGPTLIGQSYYGDFAGKLDEIRVSGNSRSAYWIKFEYHNMAQPDNELEWGAEE